jgi:hypothetical protein
MLAILAGLVAAIYGFTSVRFGAEIQLTSGRRVRVLDAEAENITLLIDNINFLIGSRRHN